MTPLDVSLRVLNVDDLERSRVLIAARVAGVETPLLVSGAMGDLQALLSQVAQDALAQARAAQTPKALDRGEDNEADDGEEDEAGLQPTAVSRPAAPGDMASPAPGATRSDPPDAGQLTLLAFDF